MRMTVAGARDAAVAGDHRERCHHDAPHVLFVEHMINRVAAAVQHRFQHERGAVLRRGRQLATRRPVFQRLALETLVPRHARELHARQIAAAAIVQDVINDAARDAVLDGRYRQPLAELRIATGHRPTGHQYPDARVRGGVRILIHHYIGAGLSCAVHHGQRESALAPHLLPHRLVMGQHHRNVRATSDLERFGHAVQQSDAFLAQMRRVDAPAVARHLRQRDHFLDVRVRAGQVQQPGAEPERALPHRRRHQLLHARQLGRIGCARLHAQHGAAHIVVPHEIRHVDADGGRAHRIEIRRQR